MEPLKVPPEAEDAWWHYTYRAIKRPESTDDSIRAIAAPVVAAELRRLAYGFATIDDTDPAGQLLNRADEWEAACRKPS